MTMKMSPSKTLGIRRLKPLVQIARAPVMCAMSPNSLLRVTSTRSLSPNVSINRIRLGAQSLQYSLTTAAQAPLGHNTKVEPAYNAWVPPVEEELLKRPVVVIGAGNLGRRIALIWASDTRPVTLYDTSQEALRSATEYITDHLGNYCAQRGTHPGQVCTTTDIRKALTAGSGMGTDPTVQLSSAFTHQHFDKSRSRSDPWMVVECLPETLALKLEVIQQIDRYTAPDCLICSNSSSYRTFDFISGLIHPERLLNTHYFIPPRNRMVEMMSSTKTHEEVFPFLSSQMTKVGLVPMVVPPRLQSQGLIFNRIWAACKRETLAVLSEGVGKPADVDALFKDFFHAEKGPCERMDEVGLDTIAKVQKHYFETLPEVGRQEGLEWLVNNYVKVGNLGEKTGDGLFTSEERNNLKTMRQLNRGTEVEETSGA